MNTIIVFASMAGTTELMAHTLASELTRAGDQVTVIDAFETDAEELKSYDRILVKSYTWGEGDLSDEIISFYDELSTIDLTGKMAEHLAQAILVTNTLLEQLIFWKVL
jgi:flavodoxin I